MALLDREFHLTRCGDRTSDDRGEILGERVSRNEGIRLLADYRQSCSRVCVATAQAQDARLQIDHLNRLADKAAEVVEVALDEKVVATCSEVSFRQ